AVEVADDRPYAARAEIRGQEDPRRGRVSQLDEIRLVLDIEGGAEPACERRVGVADLDVDLADRRVGQKAAAEEGGVVGRDGGAIGHSVNPLGAPAAGA